MSNKFKTEMDKIEIPKELSERSKAGVSKAKKEMRGSRKRYGMKGSIAAAGVLIVIVGFSLFNNGFTPDSTINNGNTFVAQEETEENAADEPLSSSSSSSASWAYRFVEWEDESYVITGEMIPEERIGVEIGEVTSYSDKENADKSGNFSNLYEEGTTYYEITDINTEEAIAVEVQEGKFVKAVYNGIWLEQN